MMRGTSSGGLDNKNNGLRIVVLGLSLSSSWGNGHATTYRALLRALAERGHDILFLERERPWYAEHRDLNTPDYCRLAFYDTLADLEQWRESIARADAVIVGSYVPDGIAVGRFVQATARGVCAFYDIDTPVTLAALTRGECEYLTWQIIPHYDLYLSFTGGPILQRIERAYGAPAARALYCSVDTDLYKPTGGEPKYDLGYIGTYSPDRQQGLENFLLEPARQLPHMRFVVAGPQFPTDIAWPENVERIDHVGPKDHAAFYASLRYTLNVTRADMIHEGYSPSVRLFEAASCATPILSDYWPGLDGIFDPPFDLMIVRSTKEVVTVLQDVSEDTRIAMGRAARERMLKQHGARHRAEELERYLMEAAAQKRGSPMPISA